MSGIASAPMLPPELPMLLTKVVDGCLTAEQAQRLRELLRDQPAREFYVDFIATHTLLRWHFGSSAQAPGDSGVPLSLDAFFAPAAQVHAECGDGEDAGRETNVLEGQEAVFGFRLPPQDTIDEPELKPAPNILRPEPEPSRRSLWWVASAAAIVIGISVAAVLLLGNKPPSGQAAGGLTPQSKLNSSQKTPRAATEPQVMATITASINASWESVAEPSTTGTTIEAGRRLSLTQGVVELTFVKGTKVLLEAPAVFDIESASALSLHSGRLAATASGAARGFTVHTPGAIVTDLGTEFGVAVNSTGVTEVEVFSGEVQAAPRVLSAATTQPSLLKAGDAGRVAGDQVTITREAANPQAFVRSVSSSVTALDVVDLVAGGDGTTRRRGKAIDLRTGAVGVFATFDTFTADASFHKVLGPRVVDGVFVPNGSTPINSAGQSFDFPATSGKSDNHIWTGGKVPSEHAVETRVGGVNYADDGHGLLFLHSNAGVTLDLGAIRRLYPGRSLARFHCTVGQTSPGGSRKGLADVWVLVDGAPRFERRRLSMGEAPVVVDVAVGETDRFLTLSATDGGDGIQWDWVIWGDPTLDIGGDRRGGE